MKEPEKRTRRARVVAVPLLLALVAGCASTGATPRVTSRDKTAKGAGIGAAAGTLGAVVVGKRKAKHILVGAAIGAAAGAGVGAYMDAQEEKLARIPGTSVERIDDHTLLVRFDSDILFDVDSARLDGAANQAVGEVAGVLAEYDKTAVVVQGHTDSTGSGPYNLDLSTRRAATVKQAFIADGVAAKRIAADGLGEDYPVASNDSETGRRQNRRVTVLLEARAT